MQSVCSVKSSIIGISLLLKFKTVYKWIIKIDFIKAFLKIVTMKSFCLRNKKNKSCTSHRLWTLSNMKRIRQNLIYLSACVKIFINVFLHREVRDLKIRQNGPINDLQLRWKQLKSNFQNFFLILRKFYYFK